MMDQSFDPFGGNAAGLPTDGGWNGGGGDTSFAATQTTKADEFDRVTLPVTVATLNTLEPTTEKIQYGTYSFSQIRVIAEIVNSSKVDLSLRYMIRDYGNEHQNPFLIVQYFGDNTPEPLVEGTIVQIIGKIRTFDNQSSVIAFKVLEVPDRQMLQVFPKEARVAELYFTKNVPALYASGEMTDFIGTFLSPEPPVSNSRPAAGTPARTPFAPANNATTPSALNGSNIYNSTQRPGRGNNVQQNTILDYLKTHQVSSDEGLSFQVIKAGVRGNANFDADIRDLVQNGVLYTTIDDNHYATITE